MINNYLVFFLQCGGYLGQVLMNHGGHKEDTVKSKPCPLCLLRASVVKDPYKL